MAGIEKGVGFPITASDQFSGAFDKLKGRVTEAQSNFEKLKGMATLAVAGISIAGMFALVQHTIDAADQMGKLSQKTGIAVAELSKLAYGAKLSDVEMESFGKGIKAFSAKLVEANDQSSKAAKLLKALGVDIHAGPAKAFEQLAEGVSKMRDGEVKTTLATELLSKAGMGMIPWLNQGTAGFRRAADEASRLGLVMSEETSKAAEQFNDNMKALKSSAESLGLTFVNQYGKGLADATGAMKEALIESGKLTAAWVALGTLGAFLFTDSMLSDAEKYRRKIAELTEQMAFYNKEAAIAAAKGASGKAFLDAAAAADAQRRAMMQAHDAPSSLDPFAGSKAGGATDIEDRIRGILSAEKEARNAGEELIATLEKELAKLSNLTGEDKKLIEMMIEIDKLKKQGKAVDEGRILLLATEIDKKKEMLRIDKFLTEEHQKDIDFTQARGDALAALSNEWDEMTRSLDLEVELLGKSNLEREKAILLRKREEDITAANNEAATIRDINDAYEKQISLLERKNAIQEQLSQWNELADKASGFFANLVMDGRNAFRSLGEELKNFARELIALFAKRWILNMVAAVSGSSALGSAAGQVGQGTAGGLVMNGLTSLAGRFGGTAVGNYLGGTAAGTYLGFGASGALSTANGLAGIGALEGGGNAALLATYNSTASTSLASGLSNAAGALGIFAIAVGAAIASMKFYSQGWNNAGLDSKTDPRYGWASSVPDTKFRLLSALGINSKWADIMSGAPIMARLFGHRSPTTDASGVSGTIGAEGVSGQNWLDWTAKGGWFRSDKHGSETQPFSAEQQDFFKQMFAGLADVIKPFAGGLGVDPTTALAGYSHEFKLDTHGKTDAEITTLFNDLFAKVLQDQTALVLESSGKGALAKYVRELTGGGDAIMATIQNIMGLVDAADLLGRTITALEGGPVEELKNQLKALDDRVTNAKTAFQSSMDSSDPAKILAAQQVLMQAITDRYTAEIQMVQQLQNAIRQLEDQAYQFALTIAQRISSVGGSRDIGGLALDRANGLRGRLGSGPLDLQAQDIQGYVGAIDTWYDSRRSAIEKQMAAEQAASQAIANAQAAAAQARVTQLQDELAMAQQFQGIVDRTTQMLNDMRLSSSNPLALSGRLDLARADVDRLRGIYEGSTGGDRALAANKLLDALQTYRGLGQEANQRPSPEWERIYNEITSELTKVQGDAQSIAERTVDIQQQILAAQNQALAYQAMAASTGQASSAALDALNKEAAGYYEYAEKEGARIFAAQRASAQDQLNAITGGIDVQLFIAARNAELVSEVKGLREDINRWLSNGPAASSGGSPTDTAAATNPAARGNTVVLNLGGGRVTVDDVIDAVKKGAPVIRRALANS